MNDRASVKWDPAVAPRRVVFHDIRAVARCTDGLPPPSRPLTSSPLEDYLAADFPKSAEAFRTEAADIVGALETPVRAVRPLQDILGDYVRLKKKGAVWH